MLYQQPGVTLELGWEILLPLLFMVVLFALAVPVWVALGFAAIGLLVVTDVLPLSLFGEALFNGIDAFALIAIPLYVLTGDVLVRSGLSNKLLDVAEATMGSLRTGFGTSTVLGGGFFGLSDNVQIEGLLLQHDAPGFDARHLQHVVDQGE